jgi:hypothetical protein
MATENTKLKCHIAQGFLRPSFPQRREPMVQHKRPLFQDSRLRGNDDMTFTHALVIIIIEPAFMNLNQAA